MFNSYTLRDKNGIMKAKLSEQVVRDIIFKSSGTGMLKESKSTASATKGNRKWTFTLDGGSMDFNLNRIFFWDGDYIVED